MLFQRVKTPGLGHNAYVIGCGGGQAVIVDPRRDIDEYLQIARSNNLTITHVLETHRQEDFEFGSSNLAKATGAKVVTGKHELFGKSDIKLADGEELKIGSTRFVALETPGHTPESMSYAVYAKDSGDKCWGVLTGDALFVGEAGRTDLTDPEKAVEHAAQMYDSVHAKIEPLGDQTLVLPAHGAGSACGGNVSDRDDTTLGIERTTNPIFTMARDEFAEHKGTEKLPRPPYFRHMEKVNLEGGRALPSQAGVNLLQPEMFRKQLEGRMLIDVRDPEAFAGAHLHGAYNVWLGGLSTFGGWIAADSPKIALIVDEASQIPAAVDALARVGVDSVEVAMVGVDDWREQGLPIETLGTTGARQVHEAMQGGEKLTILDVRDDMEWEEKHIPQAKHRYVGYLEDDPPDLPKQGRIVVHCSVGHRSGLATSILRRLGYDNVHNMLGGITAWEKLALPLQRQGE